MSLKKYLFVSFILFYLLVAGLYSQEPKGNNMNNIDFLKRELNLNESQAEKIKIIMSDSLRQVELKHIELERAILDLREELLKNTADLTKIKSIIDKKTAISGDIELMAIKRDLLIKSILTAEQYSNWERLKEPERCDFFNTPYTSHHSDKKPFMDPNDERQKHPKTN